MNGQQIAERMSAHGQLGLTTEQLDARKLGIGGSDAGRIMTGDWGALWREKTGRAEPEDLSGNLAVQMGSVTEAFNAYWFEKQTGWLVLSRNEQRVSARYPFMRANLDGVSMTSKGKEAYWDAKHVGRFDEATILRYTPQMVHCCTILGLDWWVLSVFIGSSKWETVEQEVDFMYQSDLIARERQFWGYVERDEEPPEPGAAVLAPKPTPKLRTIDIPVVDGPVFAALAQENNWLGEACRHIRTFVDTDGATKVNGIARAALKDMVPEDVGVLTRGLYKFHRDKSGAVRMSVTKGDE